MASNPQTEYNKPVFWEVRLHYLDRIETEETYVFDDKKAAMEKTFEILKQGLRVTVVKCYILGCMGDFENLGG